MVRTRVGYTGGSKPNPTYRALGDHTEAIEIDFDPGLVSYEQLLDIFWDSHNPTSPAYSSQYKSAIWYHGEQQRLAAKKSKERLEERGVAVTTEILHAATFTRAEDYHQKYYLRARRELYRALTDDTALADDEAFVDSTAAARANAWVGGSASPESILQALAPLELPAPKTREIEALLRR